MLEVPFKLTYRHDKGGVGKCDDILLLNTHFSTKVLT